MRNLTWKPAPKPDKQIQQKHAHENQKNHQLCILPPHPPPQVPTLHPKLPRARLQAGRLVHQQINPLAPLQHPLDILRHDPLDAINLPLRLLYHIVVFAALAVLCHGGLHRRVEFRHAIGRRIGDGVRAVAGGEKALQFEEVGEGELAGGRGGGDDEEGEAGRDGGGGGRGDEVNLEERVSRRHGDLGKGE